MKCRDESNKDTTENELGIKLNIHRLTAQKMKLSIKDFFSKFLIYWRNP